MNGCKPTNPYGVPGYPKPTKTAVHETGSFGSLFFWSLHLDWGRIEGTIVVQNAGLGEASVMTVMVCLNPRAIFQTLLYKAAT